MTTEQQAQQLNREQRFRERILDRLTVDASAGDRLDIETMHISLLVELYPITWHYGPRGEIYLRQLDRIETLIDNIWHEYCDDSFITEFCGAFGGVNSDVDATVRNHVYQNFRAEGYPSTNLGWLDDYGREDDELSIPDNSHYINHHVYWEENQIDREKIGWDLAFETFTYISLFLPLIEASGGGSTELRQRYTDFCKTWGIQP